MSENIFVKNSKVHNLKNVSVEIPRNQFVVVTGVSGSGKSSLAFHTLYAEGQRRYVESLSSYARQFLGKIQKPDVENIIGIPPSIAIEQKVNTKNPRSTVGTSTEIYDYIKLLFARIGKTYSPISNQEVKKQDTSDVVDFVCNLEANTKVYISAPMSPAKDLEQLKNDFSLLISQGFSRILFNEKALNLSVLLKQKEVLNDLINQPFFLLIDRLKSSKKEEAKNRLADSVQIAFYEGKGQCAVFTETASGFTEYRFSNQFELDGISFEEPSVNLFSFNNPYGACPQCEGFGQTIGIDADLVIPNVDLSIYQDAIVPWRTERFLSWKEALIQHHEKFNFPIHKPYCDLSEAQKKLVWEDNRYFKGLNTFFKMIEKESYKIQYRVLLSRYRGKTTCPMCEGKRLRKEAGYVKINGKSISDLVHLPISKLKLFFENISLNTQEKKIAERILKEINNRLLFLENVGLSYLHINRLSSTLSGGESQRINLATSLGSSLVGSLYILDEPSIGLHSKDTEKLIEVLLQLRDLGNTVIVVEHDEDIMRKADLIIDMGKYAGHLGGELVHKGDMASLKANPDSLTGAYLSGKETIILPVRRRSWNSYIGIEGAKENNLKNIDVKIPLNVLTVVCGVSGSGKSSLIKKILTPALDKKLGFTNNEKTGRFNQLTGDFQFVQQIEYIDQNPIGKSSRSNPVTYIKAFDEIRQLFTDQPLAKQQGLKSSHFSFNVAGGRCDQCKGEGEITVEMQFMADVHLTCESCRGKRFKQNVLDVNYRGKNIAEVLDLTVEEAIAFFSEKKGSLEQKIVKKLQLLETVGLGYVHLGQSSSTLSGGESQRIKLAWFLGKEKESNSLFIFDEPTTGLHFNDVKKLLFALNALIERGNSVLIIEHNLDVIKSADWLIELGPKGGEKGGYLIAEGTPEQVVRNRKSVTRKYLEEKLKAQRG